MVQLGVSYVHVARILNCTKLTITRLIQHYRVINRTADRIQSGRPHFTTANEDRHLRILHLSYVTNSSLWHHLQWLALDMSKNGFMFNGKSQFVTSQNFQNVTGKSQLSQFLVLFACLSHINFAFVTYVRHNICQWYLWKKGTTTWCSIR